mgnify:CR=1 FL=1
MSIVEEFFTFFNDLIIGSSESSDSDDEIIGIIESSSVMNSLSAVVSRTISQYENSNVNFFQVKRSRGSGKKTMNKKTM